MIHRLNIGARLALAFGIVLALLLAMAGLAALQVQRLQHNTEAYERQIRPALEAAQAVSNGLDRIRLMESQHLLLFSDTQMDQLERQVEAARSKLKTLLADSARLAADAQDRELVAAVERSVGAYLAQWESLRQLSRDVANPRREIDGRQRLFGPSQQAYDQVGKAIAAWRDHKQVLAQAFAQTSEAAYRSALGLLGGCAAVALLISVYLARNISLSITRPVQAGVTLAEAVAQGDLTSTVAVHGHDELSRLLRALQHMNQRLSQVVSHVRDGSEQIATGTAQIATGNADLSQRTEEQAQSVQRTASSMVLLTGLLEHNARSADEAMTLARSATQAAAHGGEVMGRLVKTMVTITEASQRIGDIVAVIDSIAFQTNLLALNAAVEAAAAGDQGRGFSVVAGEVRALAQRSASAAHEIKQLIEGSVERVQDGSELVRVAGASMDDIVEQVQRVQGVIQGISGAMQEQAGGVRDVGLAMAQIDGVTQQNAALVEQCAAAADSLKVQAAHLARAVGTFRLQA